MARTLDISASMMCADFARLGEQIKALEEAGCDRLHWDVMDGHFVPNLTFGALVLESARGLTELPFDAHLMVTDPARWLDQFIAAGANSIIFHIEAVRDRASMVRQIRKRGVGAGISINPGTPVEMLEGVIRDIDLVLMMSVNPGFAGQKFVRGSVGRVRRMRALIERTGSRAKIQIDGGIRETNIGPLWRAGVDCAVLGSGLFGGGRSFRAAVRTLRAALPVQSRCVGTSGSLFEGRGHPEVTPQGRPSGTLKGRRAACR